MADTAEAEAAAAAAAVVAASLEKEGNLLAAAESL